MALNPSTLLPGQIALGDPAFPYGKAQNETAKGARDGTPLRADILNDLFGFQQALLLESGQPPSGTPDSATSSQYLLAMKRINTIYPEMVGLANMADTGVSSLSDLNGVACGGPDGETLVMVGDGSTPGDDIVEANGDWDFTARTQDTATDTLRDVCWSESVGLFVAVGDSGNIQTSPDGVTWTQRTPDASYSGNFSSVCWFAAASLFVAVGGFGTAIQTSPDGLAWTAQSAAGGYSGNFGMVRAFGSLLIAVGSDSEIQTSANGTAWAQRNTGGTLQYSTVSFSPLYGYFAASKLGTGDWQTSSDGLTWSAEVANPFDDQGIYEASPYSGLVPLAENTNNAGVRVALGPDVPVRRAMANLNVLSVYRCRLGWFAQASSGAIYASKGLDMFL